MGIKLKVSVAGITQTLNSEIKRIFNNPHALGAVLRRNAEQITDDFETLFLSKLNKGTHSDQSEGKDLKGAFKIAVRPHVRTKRGGKGISSVSLMLGSNADLEQDVFTLKRVHNFGGGTPKGPRNKRPDEVTAGRGTGMGKGIAYRLKAPGGTAKGYGGGTSEVTWWRLFDEGVQAHYIYSGKMLGKEDSPYLKLKPGGKGTPRARPRMLSVRHPGISFAPLHFFRKIATKVRRNRYNLYEDISGYTIKEMKRALSRASKKR